jgi:uncharacterized protein YjbI with pentapeptide repeats
LVKLSGIQLSRLDSGDNFLFRGSAFLASKLWPTQSITVVGSTNLEKANLNEANLNEANLSRYA